MVYAEKARELGLDKQPRFEEVLKFTYLQVLARAFTNEMQQNANAKAEVIKSTSISSATSGRVRTGAGIANFGSAKKSISPTSRRELLRQKLTALPMPPR